ncbi:GFA family protein [Shimia abyssi]|uniref:CENP-V/GFA domain-containing protein n=1 Tax=Shimia abyssi TaxID=1662395 RepID=A0A2P8F7V1_9RHOB|nr:GFA family protein [Shimia abyssi]PSL17793.1 hypothetical protein CLV88_1143 [Shimia abyssi]
MTSPSEVWPENLETHAAFEGGCTCGQVRYRLSSRPLIVHGCHCTLCQRQSGGAYAVNALIEQDRVEVLSGSMRVVRVSTPSGAGQSITRCETCGVAVWSKYHALPKIGNEVLFIRVGTLDDPATMPPDVHIHTSSKQPYVTLSEHTRRFEEFYTPQSVWSQGSIKRYSEVVKTHGLG